MWATGEERREAVGWRARACAGVTLCARARALRPRREHRAPRNAARYQYPINHAWPMRMHARAHAHARARRAPLSCSAHTCECPVRTRRPNSQTRLSYAMMTSQRGKGDAGGWSLRRSKCEGARATRAVGAKPKPYPRERESTRAHGVLPFGSLNERPFHKIKPKNWRASARTRTRGREAAHVLATLAAESAAVPNTSVAARTNPARRQHTSTAAATAATAVAAAAAASSFCTAAHSDAWRNSGTRVRNVFARTCEGLCVRQHGSHVAGGARCARVSGPAQSWR